MLTVLTILVTTFQALVFGGIILGCVVVVGVGLNETFQQTEDRAGRIIDGTPDYDIFDEDK